MAVGILSGIKKKKTIIKTRLGLAGIFADIDPLSFFKPLT